MSRNQRLGSIALAVVIAAAAIAFAATQGDDSEDQKAGKTTPATTTSATSGATAAKPEQPPVDRIVIKSNKPVGGVREIKLRTGEQARIDVAADASDQLHLHGYDIEKVAKPGAPAKFRFKANAEGVFELESHTAEDAGLDPVVARVVVQPS